MPRSAESYPRKVVRYLPDWTPFVVSPDIKVGFSTPAYLEELMLGGTCLSAGSSATAILWRMPSVLRSTTYTLGT